MNGYSQEIGALDSDQVATYDTAIDKIPRDAILAFGGSWHLDDGKHEPMYYIKDDFLSATINLFNALLKLNLGDSFLAIIADSLAAHHETSDEEELKNLRDEYTQSGTKYLKTNKSYFDRIALPENKKVFTQWEHWRKGEIYVEELGSDDPTPYEDFQAILNETCSGNAEKKLKDLRPSMSNAIKYMHYMYADETCKQHHSEFKRLVDKVVKDRLRTKVNSKFGNAPKKEQEEEIATFKAEEKQKILNFLLEECGHHLIVGILAHRLNKPIRIFYKDGLNNAVKFVQSTFIGSQLRTSGRKYLDVINMKMFSKTNAVQTYEKKSTLFDVTDALSTDSNYVREKQIDKLSTSPTDQSETYPVNASGLISMAMTMARDEGVPDLRFKKSALEKLINQKRNQAQTQHNDQQKESPRYSLSLDPRPEDLWRVLFEHFSKEATPLKDLEHFNKFINDRIKSRESSPETQHKFQRVDGDERKAKARSSSYSGKTSSPIAIMADRGGMGGMKPSPHNGTNGQNGSSRAVTVGDGSLNNSN